MRDGPSRARPTPMNPLADYSQIRETMREYAARPDDGPLPRPDDGGPFPRTGRE